VTTPPKESRSVLAESLRSQRTVVTAECLPPQGADGSSVKTWAASLPPVVRAVVVAENHETIRACALSCAALLLGEKIDPVLPLVVRDRNRIALQSDALGAAVLGVSNVLCLSGDHQSLGVSPSAAGAFDVDPVQLLQALKAMRDDGVLLGGERLAPPPALFLGAVAHPDARPMKLNLLQTEKKVAAGAQFLLTQAVWDAAAFAEWMKAVRDAGLSERTHILASVRPLADAGDVEAIRKRHPAAAIPDAVADRLRKAASPAREGIAICAELAATLKEVPGIRGVHILSAGREDAVTSILEQAGLTRA
jgi:methylenetetrahydrofolate reductase (NADPH)